MINLLNFVQSNLLGYIDPAATSVLLASITAIVVAISASAIIIWRKVKNKVSKTLHIDPNSNKEVEEDIVVTDEELIKEDAKEEKASEVKKDSLEENKNEEKPEEKKSTTKSTKPATKSTTKTTSKKTK